MILNEEQVLKVFKALNFTKIEHTIMLHIFRNYTCKSQELNLREIAIKTDYTREGIRQILARAITKIINNPVSEELFGKDINPQIAKRKREIIECINNEAYSKKFPDIYSFFAPFYTKEEVQSILEQLTQKQNRILEDVEYWHKTKFPPQGYQLDMRESFFKIVEYIFEKLIESYGVRLINQEETNKKPYDPELNVIASKALRRTIPASLPIIKKCPNFASQKEFNYTDSTSGLFDCPELEQYPRWLIVNALKKINKKGLSILHKAYGSNFRWPTPHKVRGITLTNEDSREISIIKNTIINIIKRAIKNNKQTSILKLKYNEYIDLIDNNALIIEPAKVKRKRYIRI